MGYVLVPIGDGSVTVAVETSTPPAPADSAPPDPAYEVAAENVRRLPQRDPSYRYDVQRHAS